MASKVSFGAIKGVAVPATAAVIPTLAAVGSMTKSLFDIVKFEIFRDFFQIMSLFFTGLGKTLPKSFHTFVGRFSELFSICFSCWLPDVDASTIAMGMFLFSMVSSIVASIYFYHRYNTAEPDEDVQGLEVTKWESRGARERRFTKYLALFLTTMYLPVGRDALQMMLCDLKFVSPGEECYSGLHLGLTALAVLATLIYLLPIPYVFYQIITMHKPQESRFDSEGRERVGGYTDLDYAKDLKRDASPYKSLYEAYERNWAGYKVIVMVMKFLLIVPVVLLVPTNDLGGRTEAFADDKDKKLVIQSLATLAVLAVYAGLTWLSRPFLNDSDDLFDAIARFSQLGIAVFSLLSTQFDQDFIFGIVLNVLALLTVVAAVLLFMSSSSKFRSKFKDMRKVLDLSPSSAGRKVPLVLSTEFDARSSKKLRIWHEFWESLFTQADGFKRTPNEKGELAPLAYSRGRSPPFLLGFQGTVEERLDEMKMIASTESLKAYESAIFYAKSVLDQPEHYGSLLATVRHVMAYLNGVDVYWEGTIDRKPVEGDNGPQRDKSAQTCNTHFGKLYIIPYPFAAVIVMDDTDELCVFSAAPVVANCHRNSQQGLQELYDLWTQNSNPEIVRRKEVRLILRSLEGEQVYHVYKRRINKQKSRKNGENTEHYTVTVEFTFRRGTFSRSGHRKGAPWTNPSTGETLEMATGFNCGITYHDGEGVDKEGKRWTNETYTATGTSIGLTPEFLTDEQHPIARNLQRLLRNNYWNNEGRRARTEHLRQSFQHYRDVMLGEFVRKDQALSYAFWYFVYNNVGISREVLDTALRTQEQNPAIQAVPDAYRAELDMVFAKLNYYSQSRENAVWFSFWHDVWVWNRDMKLMGFQGVDKEGVEQRDEEKTALLSPDKDTAIMYRGVMPRDQLVKLLDQHGLHLRKGIFGRGFLNDGVLDMLYDAVAGRPKQTTDGDAEAPAAAAEDRGLDVAQVIVPEANDMAAFGRAYGSVSDLLYRSPFTVSQLQGNPIPYNPGFPDSDASVPVEGGF